jgi:putative ABC transport system ATP-binding protein
MDMDVAAGEFVAILGPSGCGKTTLLNILGGLESPRSGTVEVDGVDIAGLSRHELARYRRDRVSFIFQFFNLLPNLTVEENVLVGMEAGKLPSAERARRARTFLGEVGLGDRLRAFPRQLSGGMQQRVAIARALARDSRLILADEPTGNLDQESGRSAMDLIQRVHRVSSACVVLITHDRQVAALADRVLKLEAGKLA